MEYCPGGDFREFLSALGALEEQEAALYFAEMIMGVSVLHKLGYIHRDLKPDNFLIDARGHLKLADFGLSKERPSNDTGRLSLMINPGQNSVRDRLSSANLPTRFQRTITQSQKREPIKALNSQLPISTRKAWAYSVVGSPDYMSPDVVANLNNNQIAYDEMVDWWSLGCCFFECILGVPPFQADTAEEIFENITNWKKVLAPLWQQYGSMISPECFSLLNSLLCEKEKRLGKDLREIQTHPFFKNLDWANLDKVTPPFVPKDEFLQALEDPTAT